MKQVLKVELHVHLQVTGHKPQQNQFKQLALIMTHELYSLCQVDNWDIYFPWCTTAAAGNNTDKSSLHCLLFFSNQLILSFTSVSYKTWWYHNSLKKIDIYPLCQSYTCLLKKVLKNLSDSHILSFCQDTSLYKPMITLIWLMHHKTCTWTWISQEFCVWHDQNFLYELSIKWHNLKCREAFGSDIYFLPCCLDT